MLSKFALVSVCRLLSASHIVLRSGGVLCFQYERQRAVGDDLRNLCRYGLALSAVDTFQCFAKVGIEACSILAE